MEKSRNKKLLHDNKSFEKSMLNDWINYKLEFMYSFVHDDYEGMICAFDGINQVVTLLHTHEYSWDRIETIGERAEQLAQREFIMAYAEGTN
jgi:hypothetical protein